MSSLKNVIEDIVVKVAQEQLEQLWAANKQKVNLHEVVAYALNRLPTMYATTYNGWIHQRSRALNEIETQIVDAVQKGIRTALFGDPLHDSTPIPEVEVTGKALALVKLRKILGKVMLRWRDVPDALEYALNINQPTQIEIEQKSEVPPRLSRGRSNSVIDIKSYLQRSKKRQETKIEWQTEIQDDTQTILQVSNTESEWAKNVKEGDRVAIEQKELESYVLKAKLKYVNVLEKFVISATESYMSRLSPEIQAKVNSNEVVSYALNRLPPMYATSDRGYRLLRQKAINELRREVVIQVRQGIMKVGRSPQEFMAPHPLEKFNKECDQALAKIKTILQCDEINDDNVAELVEKAIRQNQKNSKTQSVRQSWQPSPSPARTAQVC